MIVIPKHRRFLLIRIMVRQGFTGRAPAFRISIRFGRYPGSVNMDHGPNLRLVHFRSVETMIYGEKMTTGQFVCPLDRQFVAAARLEGRPRPTAVVGPQAGGT